MRLGPKTNLSFATAIGLMVNLAVVGFASPANADGNVLQIVQEGNDNSLTVNQSAASNSSVNGLFLDRDWDNFVVDEGDKGHRGHGYHGKHHRDWRYWWKKQHHSSKSKSLLGGIFKFLGHHGHGKWGHHHNGLTMGDSAETISFERLSAAQDAESPALQKGSGNSASIVLEGNGGQVGLLQINPLTGGGHTANINVYGDGSALVGQLGDNNVALLTVDGGSGAILQDGLSNQASLSVGSGSTGLISQIGNSNETSLVVPSGGANVSYLVYGNGLTGSTPAAVVSNAPGTVVIRQYQSGMALIPGSGS